MRGVAQSDHGIPIMASLSRRRGITARFATVAASGWQQAPRHSARDHFEPVEPATVPQILDFLTGIVHPRQTLRPACPRG
jgi:hypothetical protein